MHAQLSARIDVNTWKWWKTRDVRLEQSRVALYACDNTFEFYHSSPVAEAELELKYCECHYMGVDQSGLFRLQITSKPPNQRHVEWKLRFPSEEQCLEWKQSMDENQFCVVSPESLPSTVYESYLRFLRKEPWVERESTDPQIRVFLRHSEFNAAALRAFLPLCGAVAVIAALAGQPALLAVSPFLLHVCRASVADDAATHRAVAPGGSTRAAGVRAAVRALRAQGFDCAVCRGERDAVLVVAPLAVVAVASGQVVAQVFGAEAARRPTYASLFSRCFWVLPVAPDWPAVNLAALTAWPSLDSQVQPRSSSIDSVYASEVSCLAGPQDATAGGLVSVDKIPRQPVSVTDFAGIEAGHGTARERLAEIRRQFSEGEFVQVGSGAVKIFRNATTKAFVAVYECRVPGLSKDDLYSLAEFSRDTKMRNKYDDMFDYGETLASVPNSRSLILRQCMKKVGPVSAREFLVGSYIGDIDDGAVYAIATSIEVESYPEESDSECVRGNVICGGFAVNYDDSQGLLTVHFYSQADIKGKMPEWVVQLGAKSAMVMVEPMTKTWLDLRARSPQDATVGRNLNLELIQSFLDATVRGDADTVMQLCTDDFFYKTHAKTTDSLAAAKERLRTKVPAPSKVTKELIEESDGVFVREIVIKPVPFVTVGLRQEFELRPTEGGMRLCRAEYIKQ